MVWHGLIKLMMLTALAYGCLMGIHTRHTNLDKWCPRLCRPICISFGGGHGRTDKEFGLVRARHSRVSDRAPSGDVWWRCLIKGAVRHLEGWWLTCVCSQVCHFCIVVVSDISSVGQFEEGTEDGCAILVPVSPVTQVWSVEKIRAGSDLFSTRKKSPKTSQNWTIFICDLTVIHNWTHLAYLYFFILSKGRRDFDLMQISCKNATQKFQIHVSTTKNAAFWWNYYTVVSLGD